MVFPVGMYGSESWAIKKAEPWRIDAFELWCWRRLLRVPRTAKRSNQSILKEISPEYSLEGLMLKLKLQYFGHLMQRADSLENTLMLGKFEGGRRGRQRGDGWMASPTQWTSVWVNSELVMDREAWCAPFHGVTKSWTWLSDWTELNWLCARNYAKHLTCLLTHSFIQSLFIEYINFQERGLIPKDTTSKPNRTLTSWRLLSRWVETVIKKKTNNNYMITFDDSTRKQNN